MLESVLLLLLLTAEPEALTLERAVSLAQRRNERAALASEALLVSEARLARARAAFLPSLGVGASYTRRAQESRREVGGESVLVQRADALAASASLRAPLFDARAFPLHAAAAQERRAAELELDEVRRQLGFEAAAAFTQALTAQRVLMASEARLSLARESLADARARAAASLSSVNDVTSAELEVAVATREQLASAASLTRARLTLEYLLDSPVPPRLVEPAALLERARNAAPAPAAEHLELEVLRARAAASRAAAVEPQVRWVPALALTGVYRLTNEPGLFGRSDDGALSVELTWALFDGGARYAEADERRALARQAELLAGARARALRVDAEAARVELSRTRDSYGQAQVAASLARRNADEVATLYRQGLAGALAVADAATRRFEAEVSLATLEYGVLQAFLQLRSAQGFWVEGGEP